MRISNIIDDPAYRAMQATGLAPLSSTKTTRLERVLEENGLSLDETVEELAKIVKFADKEETRLRGTELALKLNGVMKDDMKREVPQIVFKIEANGPVSLNQILCPER